MSRCTNTGSETRHASVGLTTKVFIGGTQRTRDPAATLQWVQGVFGVVGITRVADVTGLDHVGIPVVTVMRPNTRSIAVSIGKGLTLEAAKASGVMEAIEGWHAERPVIPLTRASFNEIRLRGPVADVAGLPRTQASTFHADQKLLWARGTDLLSGHATFVPYEMVHTDYTLPLPDGSGAFFLSSNGLASGNHALEAISHGICEVVERDGLALFHYRGESEQRARLLDLDSVDVPEARELLAQFSRCGLRTAVWDACSDIGLPVFRCQIGERDPGVLTSAPHANGSGCHPNRDIALLRALTEAAQVRLTLISGARDGMSRGAFSHSRDPEVHRSVPTTVGDRQFADCPTFDSGDFEADIKHEQKCLQRAGITQAVAVDLTREELRIPVARVIIPGLEGIHNAPGYRPGRRARQIVATQ